MGRGTISGETGEGLYSLDLDYGAAELQAAIDKATARSAALDGKIIDALNAKLYASNAITTQKGIVNAAINAYRDALAANDGVDDARKSVDAANIELLKLSVPLRVATAEHQDLANEKTAIEARIAYLSGFNLTSTVSAWCADYTTEATGEVATVEVPGEPATTLIAPGAVAPAAGDGEVTARVVQSASQSYWNIAALPSWQKWKPTYRFAVIDAIDRELNTCDLTLDAATSTAQGLGINQEGTLSGVAFDYMDCHHRAFTAGDDVLVRFVGQDWAQPKVVGFKDNPKRCSGGILRYIGTPEDASPAPSVFVSNHTIENEYNLLTALRGSSKLVPTLPYKKNLLVEFRPDAWSDWVICPLNGITYYTPSVPEFDQVSGQYPVRWGFDVIWAGVVRYVVWLFDASGENYHVINSAQPPNTSLEDNYYYAWQRNMVYAASDQHTTGAVVAMIFPRGDGMQEWPEIPIDPNPPGDILWPDYMEFRIRTFRHQTGGIDSDNASVQSQLHLHVGLNFDTLGVSNYRDVDLLTDPVYTDQAMLGPQKWLDPSYNPAINEPSFLPDGDSFFYYYNGPTWYKSIVISGGEFQTF